MEENKIIDVTENIKNEIKSNDVVLFMKGTPVFSMCGFSAATVQVLSDIEQCSVNVLDSNEMREELKNFKLALYLSCMSKKNLLEVVTLLKKCMKQGSFSNYSAEG